MLSLLQKAEGRLPNPLEVIHNFMQQIPSYHIEHMTYVVIIDNLTNIISYADFSMTVLRIWDFKRLVYGIMTSINLSWGCA